MRIKRPAQPKMPEYSDYSSAGGEDFVTDGTQETTGADRPGICGCCFHRCTVDTSGIENAIEQATSDLADLQSDLASQKSIAEADSTSLTEEEKEKMLSVSNNLTELDAKSAKELVEEGKKGISADFNGVISKSAVQQGASGNTGNGAFYPAEYR